MPPKRKSNRGKRVPKPKKQHQEQEEKPTRNWLELPSDIMLNILYRIGVVCILTSAQKVCTFWRDICNDPAMWRVVHMEDHLFPLGYRTRTMQEMCMRAVDRSRGQLVDLALISFCDDKLLDYIAQRSSQLKRLVVMSHLSDGIGGIRGEPFAKLSALEELTLVRTGLRKPTIEAIGRYCPLLKTLKLYEEPFGRLEGSEETDVQNEIAIGIGENLPGLTHLVVEGRIMQNIGLEAILNGCRHLESLDLRWCSYVDLKGELGKRCLKQVKNVRLPHEYVS